MNNAVFSLAPRLFISYAREDIIFARSLNAILVRKGFQTFLDEEKMLVGDVFPVRIIDALRKSDGFIMIVSGASINSEWCKLESYYAYFHKKVLIPIRIGDTDYDTASPLRNLQRDIQYVVAEEPVASDLTVTQISRKLTTVRRFARKRLFRVIAVLLSILLVVSLSFMFGVRRINSIAYEREKSQLISAVASSNKIYREDEIHTLSNKFGNDDQLVAQLYFQRLDPGLSDIARINATTLSASLLQSFRLSSRQYFKAINWHNSFLAYSAFNNVSFQSGSISGVNFSYTQFNDVYFCGFDDEEHGIQLGTLSFKNCWFNAATFAGNTAIGIEFQACRFNGSTLNTTHFGAVKFFSDTTADPDIITNGVLSSFTNCIIENLNELDPPGVIVLEKEKEMQFVEVLFDQCTFKGLVRPEWFRKCTFLNCRFPSEEIAQALAATHIMSN